MVATESGSDQASHYGRKFGVAGPSLSPVPWLLGRADCSRTIGHWLLQLWRIFELQRTASVRQPQNGPRTSNRSLVYLVQGSRNRKQWPPDEHPCSQLRSAGIGPIAWADVQLHL